MVRAALRVGKTPSEFAALSREDKALIIGAIQAEGNMVAWERRMAERPSV